jgi:hypothetical protein
LLGKSRRGNRWEKITSAKSLRQNRSEKIACGKIVWQNHFAGKSFRPIHSRTDKSPGKSPRGFFPG